MRNILLKILKWKLRLLAMLTLARYKPLVVGVTGSVGKTSTKDAICTVLSVAKTVRSNPANFNNEIGLPLTIISNAREIGRVTILFWFVTILSASWRILFKSQAYPEVLVLEYAIDAPGDMSKLLRIARPHIGVVTAIGEIPVHVEFFAGPQDVAREKKKLVKSINKDGFAVLNHDDITVLDMESQLRAHVLTFGFAEGSGVRATNIEHRVHGGVPQGVAFKLGYGGIFLPVQLKNSYGKAQVYASCAAAAVGLVMHMNLIAIAQALESYTAPPGRMKLIPGLKETFILDDSYNASPESMHAALDTLDDLPGKRKIAILGDMLEIGRYTMESHEATGRRVAKICDVLITIGPRAKFIAKGAQDAGFKKKNIYQYDSVADSLTSLHNFIEKGDIILVKASRAIHLEKVVEELRDPRY